MHGSDKEKCQSRGKIAFPLGIRKRTPKKITIMNSREKILEAVLKNQPQSTALPALTTFPVPEGRPVDRFSEVFMEIGGFVYLVNGIDGIREMLNMQSEKKGRMVTTILELQDIAELVSSEHDPHSYSDVELAIIKGHFGVAENGAVWITDELMVQRALPYICQHLAVVIEEETIQKTLHEAYEKIGEGSYGFGGFISGPSKTADIEQALVLGAHGPLSMTVFILQSNKG